MEKCVEATKNMNRNVYLAEIVKTPGAFWSKKEKILVISDFGLHFFKENTQKASDEFEWFSITKYDSEQNSIKFKAKNKEISFEFEESSRIPNIFETALRRIRTNAELSDINSKLQSDPTAKSAYFRTINLQNDISKEVNQVLRFQENKLTLNDSNIDKYLDVIPLISSVKSLEIVLQPKSNILRHLTAFLLKDTHIEHLHFIGVLPPSFNEIISAITTNAQSHVRALSFTETAFSESHFYSLISLVNAKTIRSLSFHNAFATNIYHFYNKFLPSIRKGLRTINLRDSNGLTLQGIFTSRTVVVSLEGCNMEISSIFEALSANAQKLKNLREINIGNNKCTKSFRNGLVFPEFLSTIYAGGIQWRGFHMKSFFEILFKCFQRGLELSFTNTNALQGDWDSVNDLFRLTTYKSLLSIDWSGNPISRQFIQFIGRNKFLEHIDVSECFTEEKGNDILTFCNFLEGTKSLKKLVLKGSSTNKIGSMLKNVLESVAKNTSLIEVDLSYSYAPTKCIEHIKKFISKHGSTRKINIDGMFPTNFKSYNELITKILENDAKKLFIEFPDNDIKQFVGSEITYKEYMQIMGKFAKLIVKKESNLPFDEPFALQSKKKSKEFPEYTTEEDVMALLAQQMIPLDALSQTEKVSVSGRLNLSVNGGEKTNSEKSRHNRTKSASKTQKANETSPFQTPIWSTQAKDDDENTIRRHKHRTPMTLAGEERTEKKHSSRKKTSNTLQGEEMPKPKRRSQSTKKVILSDSPSSVFEEDENNQPAKKKSTPKERSNEIVPLKHHRRAESAKKRDPYKLPKVPPKESEEQIQDVKPLRRKRSHEPKTLQPEQKEETKQSDIEKTQMIPTKVEIKETPSLRRRKIHTLEGISPQATKEQKEPETQPIKRRIKKTNQQETPAAKQTSPTQEEKKTRRSAKQTSPIVEEKKVQPIVNETNENQQPKRRKHRTPEEKQATQETKKEQKEEIKQEAATEEKPKRRKHRKLEETNENKEKKEEEEKIKAKFFLPVPSEDEPLFVQPLPLKRSLPKEEKKEPVKEEKDSNNEEPLFIFESDKGNSKENQEDDEQQEDEQAKNETQYDEKWEMPSIPAYPIPEDIWDNAEKSFVIENIVEEIKQMPIDMHYHHKPGANNESFFSSDDGFTTL